MKIDLKNLPSGDEFTHRIITDLVAALIAKDEELELKKAELVLLRAKLYGKSSEKIKKRIDDLTQQIEEDEAALAEAIPALNQEQEAELEPNEEPETKPETSSTIDGKNKPKRKKLPSHLERSDVVLNPDPKCPSCGGEDFRKISDDISETLEYVPSSFKVMRHIRPRCACINCETIVQAYPKSGGIDKSKAGPGLLAHILVQKYCNHLPFYRQSEIYAREEIELSRSTMASWAGQCSRLLAPVIVELKKSVFSSYYIHGDDTPIKVLAPGFGKTKLGRIWAYVRDGRPCGDLTPPAVCYFYSPDRKGERPFNHLKDFTGVLHADAYSGYDKIYQQTDKNNETKVTEAACWAHTRRKFYEVTLNSDNAVIAFSSIEQIGKIYAIEQEIRGLDPGRRREERQSRSRELVDKLFAYWKKLYHELPKKSGTAQAINYAMNNEDALYRFLDDGRIEIDNNAAERAMRSIAIGRKNWLFAGSDRGGETAADIYSLIETAKMNGLNPWQYLRHVLSVIQDYNSTKIAELLPWNLTKLQDN